MQLAEYRDKPLEEVRDKVMDLLATYYARGAMELEDYERKAEAAVASTTRVQLESLVGALPALPAPEQAAPRARVPPADRSSAPLATAGEVRPSQTFASVFSGVSKRGEWYPARSTQVVAFFGGVDLDYTHAHLPEGVSTIRVLCAFGGVSIVVPPGVAVESSGIGIFGAFDNQVPDYPRGEVPTLRIEGLCLFGGTEVKLKRPKH
jgi:hypothetical protein